MSLCEDEMCNTQTIGVVGFSISCSAKIIKDILNIM